MIIDTSHNIIPGNVRETLTSEGVRSVTLGKKGRANNNVTLAISGKSFSDVHGAVLSNIKSLSAKRYVRVGDTHGKSGFSALGQILSNIGHNIRALFAGNDSAERDALEASVKNLGAFAEKLAKNKDDISLNSADVDNLKQLYEAVRQAKEERVKQGNDWENIRDGVENAFNLCKNSIVESIDDLKAKFFSKLTDSEINEKIRRDISDPTINDETKKAYKKYLLLSSENPFETLVLMVFTTVPGDTKAMEALNEDWKTLQALDEQLLPEVPGFKDMINAYITQLESLKLNASLPLADRLETALRVIAERAGFSLSQCFPTVYSNHNTIYKEVKALKSEDAQILEQ